MDELAPPAVRDVPAPDAPRRARPLALLERIAPWVWLLSAAQVAALLAVIVTQTDAVPLQDEWELVKLLRATDAGTLRFADLWAVYNGHRVLAPRLLELLLISLSHWNRPLMMVVNVAVGVAMVVMLARVGQATIHAPLPRAALYLLTTLLLLTFSLYEDWFLTFSVNLLLAAFGVIGCMALLVRWRPTWTRLALAGLAALLASVSALPGLLAWFVFFPLVWRGGRRQAAAWAAAAAATVAFYLVGYSTQTALAFSPVGSARYALTYLGAPLRAGGVAPIWGLIGLGLLAGGAWVAWRLGAERQALLAWLGLAAFALGCACATALGRGSAGFELALSSRYQVFSGIWWIAIAGVVALAADRLLARHAAGEAVPLLPRQVVVACAIALALAGQMSALTNGPAYAYSARWLAAQRADAGCVRHYQTAPDSCLRLYDLYPNALRSYVPYLEAHHDALFAGGK